MRAAPTGVGIVGMGVSLPETIRTNDAWPQEWVEALQERLQSDLLGAVDEAVRRRSKDVDPMIAEASRDAFSDPFRGTRERRVIEEGRLAADMEAEACRGAIASAGLQAGDIDLLVGYSLIRDRVNVENHGSVAHLLGLDPSVAAFEVSAGCSSFLHGLRVAVRLIQAGDANNAVVYAGTSISRVVDYRQPSSVIPGDGAVAAVVSRVHDGEGFIGQANLTLGELHDGVLIVPDEHPQQVWWRTDQYQERLLMRRVDGHAGHYMAARAATLCQRTVDQLFEVTGYGAEDVDWFVCPQVTAWFARAMAQQLGLDPEHTLGPAEHFERYGHMMAASGPMNLFLTYQQGLIRPGDLLLMYVSGVGFGTVATLLRWSLPTP